MAGLAELSLKTAYHKGRDDIAADFYLPCMRRAAQYDRAVGYFRSTVFIVAWEALKDFVERGGHFRVLCSQVLAKEDIAALQQGYEAREDPLAIRFLEEVRGVLRDEELREPARILAALVATGVLDLQIAVLEESASRSPSGRIFHDKLGIFRDADSNVVIFKGSMNETWTGLAADGNLESIDVAASWLGSRDLERVKSEDAYFHDLWINNYPTVLVRPFPGVAREELEQAAEADWQGAIERLLEESSVDRSKAADVRGRSLRPHQAAGLASWVANGRRGILAFVTGSGKTFTAINAMRDAIKERHEVVVVVVPDEALFAQWYRELVETTADLGAQILRAGSGYTRWRESLRLWTNPGERPRLVLATVQTASTEEFLSSLNGGDHLMLVADEVHRLGAPRRRALLNEALFGARLGLSATPERAGDPEGTALILDYFEGVLEPRYTLADAVRDRVLVPYFYRPHPVDLAADEAVAWRRLTAEIARLRAQLGRENAPPNLLERIERLQIRRARVVKQAAAKVPLAVQVLTTEYAAGQRWLVYCDDRTQLEAVSVALTSAGLPNVPYHSKMEGDREQTLRWLEHRGGVVVAIKCLDEGVDIPSVTHALILASSKNPREFIQRRGRVLRTADSKALAYVHDAIVLPPAADRASRDADAEPDPVTVGELARAIEFAESADNPAAGADLAQIAIDIGADWRSLLQDGFEVEEED